MLCAEMVPNICKETQGKGVTFLAKACMRSVAIVSNVCRAAHQYKCQDMIAMLAAGEVLILMGQGPV